MQELLLEDCKKIEYGILKFIHKICRQNNLRYYLAYGTLLGAIRHGGFIPWDDDIDVFMPYEDYMQLIEIMKYDDSPYQLVSYEMNRRFTAPLPKMIDSRTIIIQDYGFIERVQLGVYVDIFILNGIGDDKALAIKKSKYNLERLGRWAKADCKMFPPNQNKIKGFLRWITNIPYKIIGIEGYLRRIAAYRAEHLYDSSDYITQTSLPSVNTVEKNVWRTEDFGEPIELQFETGVFYGPRNFDFLLTEFYGDYLKLPPKEKQKTEHRYKAYYKDNDNKGKRDI